MSRPHIKLLTIPFRQLGWTLIKQKIRHKFPTVKQLNTEELATWLEKEASNLQLIDTRDSEEFTMSHLPHAQHIPDLETAQANLNSQLPIIAYCSVGYRSSKLVEQLQSLGYQQVWNLEGSIFQWHNEGRTLHRNGEETRLIHPYNRFWKWLLK